MKISAKQMEDSCVLSIEGRIDKNSCKQFGEELMRVIESSDCVYLDFTEVEYVSSAGLRALLSAQKKVNRTGKELVIRNINEIVEAVFEQVGFMGILTVE